MRNILKKPSQIKQVTDALGITGSGSGAVATGVSGAQSGSQVQQTLTFNNVKVAIADNADVAGWGALKFFTFDKGLISIAQCVVNLSAKADAAGLTATFNGDFSVGTVTNAHDATLTSTEANVVASASVGPAAASVAAIAGHGAPSAVLDGTGNAISLFLNLLIDVADESVATTPTNLVLNGTVTLTYTNLGN